MSDQRQDPGQLVVRSLASPDFQGKLKTSLPSGMDVDRFTRITITALQTNPDILKGDKNSLYLAILSSAQAGLKPDGKEAALVRFGDKVQFMPMVAGIILRLAGSGITCDTQVVHENDTFDVEYGDEPKITHKPPKLGADRGKMIGAYAILKAKEGTVYREVMDAQQIEAVRAQSRAKNSLMWTQFQGEAWRKTVLRRCAKRVAMPLDQLSELTLQADNATFDMQGETVTPVAETAADPSVVATQEKAAEPTKSDAPSTAPVQTQLVVESEDPAPPSAREQAKPARPRALAAVVAASSGTEDIF
jgi:recombination protein RecT